MCSGGPKNGAGNPVAIGNIGSCGGGGGITPWVPPSCYYCGGGGGGSTWVAPPSITPVPDFLPTCECVFNPGNWAEACLLPAALGKLGKLAGKLLPKAAEAAGDLKQPLKEAAAKVAEASFDVAEKMEWWGLCPNSAAAQGCSATAGAATDIALKGKGATSRYIVEVVAEKTVSLAGQAAFRAATGSGAGTSTPSVALTTASMEPLFTTDDTAPLLTRNNINPLVRGACCFPGETRSTIQPLGFIVILCDYSWFAAR